MSTWSLTTLTPCRRVVGYAARCQHCLHGVSVVNDNADTCVGVVNDYAHMDKTTRTLGKLCRLLTDFKGTVRWKKVLGCVFKPNSNNLKLSLSNIFAKTKISKTVFVCSYGAQVKSFKQKIWSKISWHCPFKLSNFKMLTNLDVAECMAMIVRCWTVLNGPHMTLRRVFVC